MITKKQFDEAMDRSNAKLYAVEQHDLFAYQKGMIVNMWLWKERISIEKRSLLCGIIKIVHRRSEMK